jgi:hypothetical protein
MEPLQMNKLLSSLTNVRRSGAGHTARCPAHEDAHNSLSISEAADGKPLLFCHAGCDFESIIRAMFPKSNGNGSAAERRVVASYNYTDEKGHLLFQTLRYEPKGFSQRRPGDAGEWIPNLKEVHLVPYRLPDIEAAALVYVVEGEKDVEAMRANGLVATCNPMGAGKWRAEFSEHFRDKTVVILPDNDASGRQHAEKVARSLLEVATEILVIDLPGLAEKGDVSDFFANGGTSDDLVSLIQRAETWAPKSHGIATPSNLSKYRFTTLEQLLAEPPEDVSFVWDKTIPTGGFGMMSARPKIGKSTLARNLAIAMARGSPFLGRNTIRGKILYLCLEEKRSEVRKHFERMGVSSKDILIHTEATPEHAVAELKIAIAEFEPILVIIDPLSRVIRVPDFNDYGTMARALEPLIEFARETNCSILALHHESKSDRSGGEAVLGSTALFGAVDCLIQLKKKDNARTVCTTQRYGEDMPETVIELDRDTGLIAAKGELRDIADGRLKDDILDLFYDGRSLTENEVKDLIGTGVAAGKIAKALRSLIEEGKLSRTGTGRRNSPFLYSRTS